MNLQDNHFLAETGGLSCYLYTNLKGIKHDLAGGSWNFHYFAAE